MLTLADFLAARRTIAPYVWPTPLLHSEALQRVTGAHVALKLECWQRTGSFKVRGALHRIATLTAAQRRRGVVTASAGNHGLGVALASRLAGLDAVTIFVPEGAPQAKLQRLAASGCEIRQAGADYDATHALAEALAAEQGALYLSAYDDPVVIAGQGTVGLEILEDLPSVDLLLVPVGGGGLLAGVATAARAIAPGVRVLGVQPDASPAAYLSLRDGRAHETYPAGPTICDGLAGGFGRIPYEIVRDRVDDVLVVPETAVRDAVRWLVAEEQLVVEPSGAIAIAPLLLGELDVTGQRVAAVLTGRNIDLALLRDILNEGG